jgi:hypothetical protein
MAAAGETYELKDQYDLSSRETTGNPDAGFMRGQQDPAAVAYGDTKDDLADMARLGKRQEFEVQTNLRLSIE